MHTVFWHHGIPDTQIQCPLHLQIYHAVYLWAHVADLMLFAFTPALPSRVFKYGLAAVTRPDQAGHHGLDHDHAYVIESHAVAVLVLYDVYDQRIWPQALDIFFHQLVHAVFIFIYSGVQEPRRQRLHAVSLAWSKFVSIRQ